MVLMSLDRPGRSLHADGYVHLSPRAIAIDDLPLFTRMCGKSKDVLEHRWMIAKQLGRPLKPSECVWHKNTDPSDNRLENLVLYRRGHEPFTAHGRNTYYHEAQLAIRRLEALPQTSKTK